MQYDLVHFSAYEFIFKVSRKHYLESNTKTLAFIFMLKIRTKCIKYEFSYV